MEKIQKDCVASRIPPPVYFFICLICASVLEYFLPSGRGGFTLLQRTVAGGTILLVSFYFSGSAFIVLIRNKTPFEPSRPTTRIVKEGSFRFSRNPMYLSLLLMLSGIAFWVFSIWFFIAIPILYFLLHFFVVKTEESYLAKKFGEEYMIYKTKVRRWI